mmetsp:Transcript_110272/g.195211  ORF Transcript_110272/g.195211 Transcript_110272/m.195211 type:complete len:80 (-) Transcript_110272:101-340(-)
MIWIFDTIIGGHFEIIRGSFRIWKQQILPAQWVELALLRAVLVSANGLSPRELLHRGVPAAAPAIYLQFACLNSEPINF